MPDGTEILYGNEKGMFSVAVSSENGAFRAQSPRLILEQLPGRFGQSLGISLDGKRILTTQSGDGDQKEDHQPTVVVNWFEELKAKVPVGPN